MKQFKKLFTKKTIAVVFLAILLTGIAFYQTFFLNKIPLNGNCLMAAYSPFMFEKWQDFPTGVPFKPGILDQLRIYYPYLRLTRDQIRNFQLPLWNPYNFSGNPHMAEWQSGALYPFHLVSFFLSLENQWIFMILSPFILTFIFTYLYLKNLKLSFKSAIFGALSFSFCGFMITWSQEVMTAPHSIMWLPLLLLSLDKFIETKSRKWYLISIFSIVLSTLSGYWQTTFYLLCFASFYVAFKILLFKKRTLIKIKTLIITSFIFIIGFLLCAPQILPTWELFNLSAKKTVEFSQTLISYLLPPYQLMTFFAPDFFGHPVTHNLFGPIFGSYYERIIFIGVIPLFFTFFSLGYLWSKKRRNEILFFLFFGILFLIAIFDTPVSRWIFTLRVPLLSTVIANRTMFLNAFCFSILAAYGTNFWLKAKRNKKIKIFLATFFFFCLVYISALYTIYQSYRQNLNIASFPLNWYITSFRNLAIPLGFFFFSSLIIFLRIFKKKKIFFFIIFTLSFLHQFHFLQKFTPFSPRKFVYPNHETLEFIQKKAGFDRFFGANGLFLENNFATFYKIFSPTGYDSLNNARYAEFLYTVGSQGKIVKQRPSRSDAILTQDFKNFNLQRMASLLSIKYLIFHPNIPQREGRGEDFKTVLKDKVKLVFKHGDWKIYEYQDSLPRAFLVDDYLIEKDDQKIVDLIFSPEFDPKQKVILEEQLPIDLLKSQDRGTAEIISYNPNEVIIKTNSLSPKILFLSDSFYPGWQAAVDGQKTKIYRANYAFRSIVVPEGEHKIIFSYLPESFKLGVQISIGGLVLILLILKFIPFKT